MLTMKQLEKFVKTRNTSSFPSNLQFQIDAEASGFRLGDLGDPQKFTIDGYAGYQWKPMTTVGRVRLVEFGGLLYIADHDDNETRRMFELMNTAQYAA